MRLKHAIVAMASTLSSITVCLAQHSDVEFGYNSTTTPTAFEIEGDDFTSDGILFFEADMEDDTFGNFSSNDPGFVTNAAKGLLVNSGDRIYLRVLDANLHSAFGVGFVNYYNPTTDTLEASASRRFLAEHNFGSFTNLTFNGLNIESGQNPLALQVATGSGNIHEHIKFDLLDDGTAPLGAYGVLVRLESDFASNLYGPHGTSDLNSDPFWMVWNHGMDEADFDNLALPKFGAVPEPSSLLLLGSLALFGYTRRRRR